MMIREIRAGSIRSESQVHAYALGPYAGCQHDYVYCCARFMKRISGRREPGGRFVCVKIDAPEPLASEVKKKRGRVWMSGVCDPFHECPRE